MHRFYIPPESWNPDALALDESESHHAIDVLRMNPGDKAVVFNGRGAEATVEIAAITRKSVTLRKLIAGKSAPIGCEITLAQAVPKGKNMDLIVQKAVELGAAAICPLLSERTVIQVEEDDAARKQQKWQAVVIEAAKQCGQNWLPDVALPRSPKEFFSRPVRYDLMLIASLQPDANQQTAKRMTVSTPTVRMARRSVTLRSASEKDRGGALPVISSGRAHGRS